MPDTPTTDLRAYAAAIRMLAEAPSGPVPPLTEARDLALDAAALLDELANLAPDTTATADTLRSFVVAGVRVHTAEVSLNKYDEPVIVNGCNHADDLLANLTRTDPAAAKTIANIRDNGQRIATLATAVRASFPHAESTSDPTAVPQDNRDVVVINPAHLTDTAAVIEAVATMFATDWWTIINMAGDQAKWDAYKETERLYFAQACGNARIAASAISNIGPQGTFRPDAVRQGLQRIADRQPIANITVGRINTPVIWIQFLSPDALPAVERAAAASETGADVTIRSHGDDISGPILSLTWP